MLSIFRDYKAFLDFLEIFEEKDWKDSTVRF